MVSPTRLTRPTGPTVMVAMPDAIQVPNARDQLADLEARVANLERRINFDDGSGRVQNEIVFSYAGGLIDDAESPPIRSPYSHILVSVNFMLGTVGSTDTIIEVKRNDLVQKTVTILAGVKVYLAVVDVDIGKDQDSITLHIVTAGTDAADMTAQCRFA